MNQNDFYQIFAIHTSKRWNNVVGVKFKIDCCLLFFSFFFFYTIFQEGHVYIRIQKKEKLCLLSYLCLFPRYLVHLSSVRLVSWKWFFVSTLFCMSNTFWPDNVLEQSFIFLLVKIGGFLSLSHCILDTGVYFIIQNNEILYDMM